MSTPTMIKYHGQLYKLAGSARTVHRAQGQVLTELKGQKIATEREFALFKREDDWRPKAGGFEIVHLPTKFALTYVPWGRGIGQTDAEPGPGVTVTEAEALTRAKEILAHYAKNYGGLKTSISKVTGSMRRLGPSYLSFLRAD